MEREGYHVIVVETFCGIKPAVFKFLVNQAFDTTKPVIEEAPGGTKVVSAAYPPHWFQKYLGI